MRGLYQVVTIGILLLTSLPVWGQEEPSCSCVRDMLQDRPSPYPDVYSCIDYLGEGCTDPEDDIYVGFPHHAPPQVCEHLECEPCIQCKDEKVRENSGRRGRKDHNAHWHPTDVEGHGETLTVANAWGQFCSQLKSAQDYYGSKATLRPGGPRYYFLKKADWPDLKTNVTAMVVPLDVPDPESPNMKPLYFAIQLDVPVDPHNPDKCPDFAIEWPHVQEVDVAQGKLLVICGEPASKPIYSALVWLKEGLPPK